MGGEGGDEPLAVAEARLELDALGADARELKRDLLVLVEVKVSGRFFNYFFFFCLAGSLDWRTRFKNRK